MIGEGADAEWLDEDAIMQSSHDLYAEYGVDRAVPGENAIAILIAQRQQVRGAQVRQTYGNTAQYFHIGADVERMYPLGNTSEDIFFDRFSAAERAVTAAHVPFPVTIRRNDITGFSVYRYDLHLPASMGNFGLTTKTALADSLTATNNPLGGAEGLSLPGAHGDAYRLLGYMAGVISLNKLRTSASYNQAEPYISAHELSLFAQDISASTRGLLSAYIHRAVVWQALYPADVIASGAPIMSFRGGLQTHLGPEGRVSLADVSKCSLGAAALHDKKIHSKQLRAFLNENFSEFAGQDPL